MVVIPVFSSFLPRARARVRDEVGLRDETLEDCGQSGIALLERFEETVVSGGAFGRFQTPRFR
jgi:hypothetical protein